MGRLDLPDVYRDEDELASTCTVCLRWNRGAVVAFGTTVCGRASCLLVAKARAEFASCLLVAKARAKFAGGLLADQEALD